MKKQLILSLTCTLAMVVNGVGAFAQGTPPQERVRVAEVLGDFFRFEVPGVQVIPFTEGMALAETFHFVQGGGGRGGGGGGTVATYEGTEFISSFGGKVVKGAPYSADGVTEIVQTLSDGNRIVRHTASKIYRDSEGRERREQSLNAIGPWTASADQPQTIFINDPVSSVNYTLNPKTMTARKMTMNTAVASRLNSELAGKLQASTEEAKAHLEKLKAEGGAISQSSNTVVTGGARGGGGGVITARPPAEAAAGARGGFGGSGGTFGVRIEPKTESLGKQMIGNVEAEGTRTTTTIPAGAIGNESPINIISERWYSAELQVVVMTKNSDPRTGETTYRLTNVLRTEPAASLFQVPGDYKVDETQMRMTVPSVAAPVRKQEPIK